MTSELTRSEQDALGAVQVPAAALYGAQTARAVENFPISGQGIGRQMIRALGLIKRAAAEINQELGELDPTLAEAIVRAATEVVEGAHDEHFPVDVFQTGSGTSSNMNANEVIANRASELLGGERGHKHPVHPNDHVNRGQSSNDVFPSAIHLAAADGIDNSLAPALFHLRDALLQKAADFDGIVKIGRTHLQDATPIRLGQQLSGYVAQLEAGLRHLGRARDHLCALTLGGTAVGTGLNTHREFGRRAAARLSELTGLDLRETRSHFAAQGSQDAAVQTSGTLRTIAIALSKVANDIRWLGSGPRLGLGELKLPAVQPGSSIMPGKVNPVIAESLLMVCAQVIGDDAAIATCGLGGNFELNTMLPLVAHNLLEQINLLANGARNFADRLVRGMEPDRERIESLNQRSLALATAFVPMIGYDAAVELAQAAHDSGRTVEEVARERGTLTERQLAEALDLRRQTGR